jgi:predicted metalloprotease
MRWSGGRQSENIEDRRGIPFRGGMVAGGGIGMVLLVVLGLFLGIDPSVILSGGGVDTSAPPAERRAGPPAADPVREFVSVVLADTEETWSELFQGMDRTYEAPKLVLFTGAVQSACGLAQSAVGPFYCPGDRKLYLDVGFFQDLRDRFRAPGDFAQAYVIAHEVGHHVQTLLGVTDRMTRARQRSSPAERNALSVRFELQADCFAGVWGHHAQRARDLLEAGDIEEGMRAAAAIGDDRLQRQAGGHVAPESFTHGSSAQRVRWFRQGLDKGQPRECDTFAGAQP